MLERLTTNCVITLCLHSKTGQARKIAGIVYFRVANTGLVACTPVRLHGVDAPEASNQHGHAAKVSTERNPSGQKTTCPLNGDRTYSHLVTIKDIKIDGQFVDIGAIVVANDHTLDCRKFSVGRYRSLQPTRAR